MKPSSYLSELGKKYFKEISGILNDRGIDDSGYSIMLSTLCNEMAKYEEAHINALEREKIKPGSGFYNEFNNNGAIQVNAFWTIQKDAMANILKLVSKFGLTPEDYKKIQDMTKKKGSSNGLVKL